MGTIAQQFSTAFRDFATDGVASSGAHEVIKEEVRAIGPLIEAALSAVSLGSVDVIKDTRANLDADLAHPADTVALVYGDATGANNDLYIKVGASGSGSWTLTTILHDVIAAATAPTLALAEAWAEGIEPGGPGTDSAKGWAGDAALSAATAEAAAGPTYASTAAGLAATTSGQAFAVDAGGGLVSVYLNSSGTAVLQRTLATTGALAASGGAGLVGFIQAGTGAVVRTLQAKSREVVSPEDFGAVGDGVTDDTAAIQAAIDHVYGLTRGGRVRFTKEYSITGALYIGRRVVLEGPGLIWQETDNTPIVVCNKATLNQLWGLKNISLVYRNLQPATNTNARALVLSEAGKLSYLFSVENVDISGAATGIVAPQETGCFAFLAYFKNVNIGQCSDWGFDWSNATSGASTFLSMDNVWVNNTDGSEIAGSKGFRILRCNSLSINSIACDHVRSRPLFLQSCVGRVGTVAIESCDLTASSGPAYSIEVSGGAIEFGAIKLDNNTITISGSATSAGLRASDGANVRVGSYRDNIQTVVDTSSDAYYTVNATSDTDVVVADYVYTAAGSNPAPNASLADFNTPPRVRLFDGNVRRDQRGGKTHIFGTAAPVSGTWAVGDIVWNTAPTAGGSIGWVCTTAGTPGTWKTFGAVTA